MPRLQPIPLRAHNDLIEGDERLGDAVKPPAAAKHADFIIKVWIARRAPGARRLGSVTPHQRARLDEALSAAQSVQVEQPGAFSPEHDREVSAYVDGEISAAELYRRTVSRYRRP